MICRKNGARPGWFRIVRYRTVREAIETDPDCSTDNPMFSMVEQPGIGSYLMPATPMDFSQVARLPARPAPRGVGTAPEIHGKWSLRASVTSELIMEACEVGEDRTEPVAEPDALGECGRSDCEKREGDEGGSEEGAKGGHGRGE